MLTRPLTVRAHSLANLECVDENSQSASFVCLLVGQSPGRSPIKNKFIITENLFSSRRAKKLPILKTGNSHLKFFFKVKNKSGPSKLLILTTDEMVKFFVSKS